MTDNRQQQIVQLTAEIAALQQAIAALAALPSEQARLRKQLAEKQRQLAALEAASTPATPAPTIQSPSAARDVNIATNQTINNYGGADSAERAALLREYLLGLVGACNRLSLADADSSDPTRAAVELAAVYTRLEVTSTVPLSKEEQEKRPGRQHRQLTALEALAQHNVLVLLGEPGGGKSTFVNFVGLCLAQARVGQAGWLAQLGSEWPHGALLPIRIVLREFAAWLAQQPQLRDRNSPAPWHTWLAEQYGATVANALRAEIADGRAVLLLDGLDEVPSGAEGQPLAQVMRLIPLLAKTAASSRILLTCRVLDYQQPRRQLASWHTETLIPFSDELRHEFIGRWYAVLARLDRPLNGDADELCERLRAEVRQRPELRRLAGNPLLLTMMTLLNAYEGRLPEERVRLYEKCIEFLLLRWRAERGETPLRERLDLPQWSDSDLARLLDRLGFAAHSRGVSGDGETGTDLPETVLIDTARAFFAAYDPTRAYARAEAFCHYISQFSNGVLQKFGPDTYRFPHRTFQEYLAARRLVSDDGWPDAEPEFVDRALARAAEGPQWREALLLAASRQVVLNGQIRPVANLADALLAEHPERTPAWAHNAALAGEVLAEAGRERLTRLGASGIRLWQTTVTALVTVMEHLDANGQSIVPVAERIRAGRVLAELGDPRFPITIDHWRAEPFPTTFGNPPGYWCSVPAGTYTIGGWKKGEQSANIDLPQFWIARFPVTVAQLALFVAEGYGANAVRWWTPNGWRWKKMQDIRQPVAWNMSRYHILNQPMIALSWYEAAAFCAWLHEQLAEILPAGYKLRLPTEAEWEVAASFAPGAPRRMYPWSDDEPSTELAIFDESSDKRPAPVGTCPAGAAACGALDIAGNTWEWCASSYGAYPKQSMTRQKDFTRNAWDVPLRGGSHLGNSTNVRCGARGRNLPGDWIDGFGFRIVVAARSH